MKEKAPQLSPEAEWIVKNKKHSPFLMRMHGLYDEESAREVRVPPDQQDMQPRAGWLKAIAQFFYL